MNEAKNAKLEKPGGSWGTPKEFLGLTVAALTEINLARALNLKSDGSPCGLRRTTSRSN